MTEVSCVCQIVFRLSSEWYTQTDGDFLIFSFKFSACCWTLVQSLVKTHACFHSTFPFLTYLLVSQNPAALEWIYHPYQMEYPIQQYLKLWVRDQYSTQCEDSWEKHRRTQFKVYTIIPSNSSFHRVQGSEKSYFVTPANKRGHNLIPFRDRN